MQLKCLAKADSIRGTSDSCTRRLQAELLKEAKDAVQMELCRKILAQLLRVPAIDAPPPVMLKDAIEIRLAAETEADAAKIAKAVISRVPRFSEME